MSDGQHKGEWYQWRPTIADSRETQDWPEFMEWCDTWAAWTRATVPLRRLADGDDSEIKHPDWCARVYGGKR